MWLLTEHKVEDASINSRLLGCKGWVHMCRKQHAQAIVECSKALSLDSEMWEPHLVMYESWIWECTPWLSRFASYTCTPEWTQSGSSCLAHVMGLASLCAHANVYIVVISLV